MHVAYKERLSKSMNVTADNITLKCNLLIWKVKLYLLFESPLLQAAPLKWKRLTYLWKENNQSILTSIHIFKVICAAAGVLVATEFHLTLPKSRNELFPYKVALTGTV